MITPVAKKRGNNNKNKKKVKETTTNPHVYGGLDLSNIPDQPLIPSPYYPSSKSRFTGIQVRDNNETKYLVRILVGPTKRIFLGSFKTEIEAASIYARAAVYVEQQQRKLVVNKKKLNKPLIVDISDVPPQPRIFREKHYAEAEESTTTGLSKYEGVYWDNRINKWHSRIRLNGRQCNLGVYETQEEASDRYSRAWFKYKWKGGKIDDVDDDEDDNDDKETEEETQDDDDDDDEWTITTATAVTEEDKQLLQEREEALNILGITNSTKKDSNDEKVKETTKYARTCIQKRKTTKANRQDQSALLASFLAYTRDNDKSKLLLRRRGKNPNVDIIFPKIAKKLAYEFFNKLSKHEIETKWMTKGIALQRKEPYTSFLFGKPH